MIIKDPAGLGQLLRDRRKELGVTQEQAAQLCNVGTRFIGDLERGKKTIELGKALRVIQSYGLVLTIESRKLGLK